MQPLISQVVLIARIVILTEGGGKTDWLVDLNGIATRLEIFYALMLGLVWFYGILTIVGYLISKYLFIRICQVYMVWFGFMAYQPL